MLQNLDEILLELSYRVPTGIVDLTKDYQVTELANILRENGYENAFEMAQKARVYFSYLNEDKVTIVKNKETGNIYPVKNVDPTIHDIPTPKEIQKAKQSGKFSKSEPKPKVDAPTKLSGASLKTSAEKQSTKKSTSASTPKTSKLQSSSSSQNNTPELQSESKSSSLNIWPWLLGVAGIATIGYAIYEYRTEIQLFFKKLRRH